MGTVAWLATCCATSAPYYWGLAPLMPAWALRQWATRSRRRPAGSSAPRESVPVRVVANLEGDAASLADERPVRHARRPAGVMAGRELLVQVHIYQRP